MSGSASTDRGAENAARVAAERWDVCEVAEDKERRVIEELSGEGESEGSALALACDFLQQQRP